MSAAPGSLHSFLHTCLRYVCTQPQLPTLLRLWVLFMKHLLFWCYYILLECAPSPSLKLKFTLILDLPKLNLLSKSYLPSNSYIHTHLFFYHLCLFQHKQKLECLNVLCIFSLFSVLSTHCCQLSLFLLNAFITMSCRPHFLRGGVRISNIFLKKIEEHTNQSPVVLYMIFCLKSMTLSLGDTIPI